MTNPTPTLAELIERATPGPWTANEPPYMAYGLVMYEVNSCESDKWLAKTQTEANAQLIARCNPATMKVVLEALEEAHKTILREYGHSGASIKVARALTLLSSPGGR